jgi:hypothetical protein
MMAARRRHQPVICASCGRRIERRARQQKFCGQRCRQRAHYEDQVRRGVFSPRPASDTARPTHPPKNASDSKRLLERFSGSSPRIFGPRHIIEAEVFGGRNWQSMTSSDGVSVEVSRLRPRALMQARHGRRDPKGREDDPSDCASMVPR